MSHVDYIEDIGLQFTAWKLRMDDPTLSQEDAERMAIVVRTFRRLRACGRWPS